MAGLRERGSPDPDQLGDRHKHGTLAIAAAGGTLRPRLGTPDLSMADRHYETFDLEWHELGDQSHLFPLG
jgi:hypothetical protein